MILTKRIYAPRSQRDGKRILVDRLWPRGIKKEDAAIDEWLKEIAPSDVLRKWFDHDPAKWPEFKQKYKKELRGKTEILERIRNEAEKRRITLLFSARDVEHNNAAALKDILEGNE